MGIGPTVPFYWSTPDAPSYRPPWRRPKQRRPKPWLEYVPAMVGIVAFLLIILLSWGI